MELTMTIKDFQRALIDSYNQGRIDEKYEKPQVHTIPVGIPETKYRGRKPRSKNKKK